ncbi:MAG: EAL domain-containing protein [Erysipelotrichia bacterium]|nr:EAL domain-containing protein [Erysipelotrichia bacterium]
MPISLNVSRVDLFQIDIVSTLLNLLKKYQLEVWMIKLEITESVYANNTEQLLDIIKNLRSVGFRVMMDDFGSGYSSLNILKDIEIDTLKIDMRFLYLNKDNGRKGTGIIETIFNLANWMDLNVLAEGVETKQQVDYLLAIGCRYAQGYYYYQPAKAEEFEESLSKQALYSYEGIVKKDYLDINTKELLANDLTSEVLLKKMFGGIAIYDYYKGNVNIIKMNDHFNDLLKKCYMEIHKKGAKYALKEDFPRFIAMFERAQDPFSLGEKEVFRYMLNNNETVWIKLQIFYLHSQDGHKFFCGVVKDVTKMQRMQQERDAFITCSKDCIFKFVVHDHLQKKILIHNGDEDYFSSFVNQEGLEEITDNINEVLYAEDIERVMHFYNNAKDWGEREYIEFRAYDKNKKMMWISQEINYAYKEDEASIYYCLIRNISKLKQIEDDDKIST